MDDHWLEMGLSPLHCRLMHMFSRLVDDGHEVNMDNLYNSVKFARAAYSLEVPQDQGEPRKKRIKTQGVCRPYGRGVPTLVKQDVPKTKTALEAARGTRKIVVLQGNPQSQHLRVASCVDQKPFYMLSMAAEKIDWVTKTRKIYSHKANKEVEHKFLRWSLSDTYNHEMNDNDIADQLRLIYRCLRFMRRTKWWWAEFLFVWEASMVNAYLLMKEYYLAMGVEPKWTHYEFQEELAWGLLDPEGPPKRVSKSPTKAPKSRPPSKQATGARRARMTEKLLGKGGAYSIRLDRGYCHFPSAGLFANMKETAVCQLNCLANGVINQDNNIPKSARENVLICKDCDASICLQCWAGFHSQEKFERDDYCRILEQNN